MSPSHHLFHREHSNYVSPTTPTTPPDLYYFNSVPTIYQPTPIPVYSPSKRLKRLQNAPSPLGTPTPPVMPSGVRRPPRTIGPHINIHHASEPSSPVTIATTLSNHSTPAPSPSRVTIVSDSSPHDFALFDDGFALQEQQLKQLAPHGPGFDTKSPGSGSATQFGGSFANFDPSWSRYLPPSEPMDFSRQSCHMDVDLTRSFQEQQPQRYHCDDEEPPALSPSRVKVEQSAPDSRMSGVVAATTSAPTPHNPGLARLARTVSDAVRDELFNPGIAPGTARSSQNIDRTCEYNSQLPSLLNKVQNEHAMARSVATDAMMRDHSPFRADSPLHPARTQQEITQSPTRTTAFLGVGPYTSVRVRREKQAEQDTEVLRQQIQKEYEEMQQTPKTISPKDAYIEYREAGSGAIQGGLFASSQDDNTYLHGGAVNGDSVNGGVNGSYHGSIQSEDEDNQTEESFGSMATSSRRESDVNVDYGMPVFNGGKPRPFDQNLAIPSYDWSEDRSSQESFEVTSRQSDENYDPAESFHRPEDTRANDAAYSCTVQGCVQRFPSASKMSKHRREAHRNGAPLGGDSPTKSLLQGPSQCLRINPTTGKPCNTIFSRPYDLTRHEGTIHNSARKKVRCELCRDEKTFSRQDALTRHKKVKHGIDKDK